MLSCREEEFGNIIEDFVSWVNAKGNVGQVSLSYCAAHVVNIQVRIQSNLVRSQLD